MSTYLLYIVWIYTILLLAGEVDRLVSPPFMEKIQGGALKGIPWIAAPGAGLFLPGAGQLINAQPIKAVTTLVLAVLLMYRVIPRPWQMQTLNTFEMLYPWYGVAFFDALAVAVWQNVKARREERRQFKLRTEATARVCDMAEFLNRRQAKGH